MYNQNRQSPIRRGGRMPNNKPRKLLCFPPAGTGASLYYPWIDIQSNIDVCPISVPGREDRIREPLANSIVDLAQQLATDLAPELDRPYDIFGYSMGALLAYEVCLQWKAHGLPQPKNFVTLAARGPSIDWNREKPLHTLNDAAFKNMLRDAGGTPEEILNDTDSMSIFEPILRNDFRITESYQRASVLPLSCPITSYYGSHDTLITQADVQAWKLCTTQSFTLHILNEGHMLSRETFTNLFSRFN